MIWALLDTNNIVTNIIVYDGVAEYVPDGGLTLAHIPDTYKMGDTYTP